MLTNIFTLPTIFSDCLELVHAVISTREIDTTEKAIAKIIAFKIFIKHPCLTTALYYNAETIKIFHYELGHTRKRDKAGFFPYKSNFFNTSIVLINTWCEVLLIRLSDFKNVFLEELVVENFSFSINK